MVLPGRVAKETRVQFADIIKRYLAGDHSLITEIQANAVSSMPIAQMAQGSMNVEDDEELTRKRRREDIELEMMQVKLDQSKISIEQSKINVEQEQYKFFIESLDDLDYDWRNDSKLVATAKAMLLRACSFEMEQVPRAEKQVTISSATESLAIPSPAKVQPSSAKESLAVPGPAMVQSSSAKDSLAVPSPAVIPSSDAKESPAPTAPVAQERIASSDSAKYPKMSIQICADLLGLGTLSYDDRCKVAERAMELYQSLKKKIAPKRFNFICDGGSVLVYDKTEWDVIMQALKDTMLST